MHQRDTNYHLKLHMPLSMGRALEEEKVKTGKSISYLVRQALAQKYGLKTDYKHGNYQDS